MLTVHPATLTPAQAAAARDTHGLGIISDALSATVVRRVNGDRSLRLTAPYTEKNANLLIADRLLCYDGQFYRIQIPSRKERGGKRTISLEAPHILYDLEHSYIINIETAEDPNAIDGIDARTALTQILAGTPFVPGTVDVDEKMEYLDLLEVSRMEALEQLVDRWGGELQPDNWTLHLRKESGSDKGLQARVGKNISGVDVTEDIASVVTRLYVRGYQSASIESVNDGKDYLDSPALGKYATIREGFARFEDDDDPAELKRLGLEELDKRDKPVLTVRIDMVRVRGSRNYAWYADLEKVDDGDTVTVHHEFLGQNIKLRAMEVENDALTGAVTAVTLADTNSDGLFAGFSSFVKTAELVRKILDHDGNVRARTLRGEIDLLTTRLIASGSYQTAQVLDRKGVLLENTNLSSPDYGALYIGPGILAIADSKTPEGAWEWRTFGTGKGFTGSEILAYSIHGTKIQAHSIGAEQLSPEIITEVVNNATGQQLVLEFSNGSILDADNTTTIARLRVYHQGVEITDRVPDGAINWERVSDDPEGDALFNQDPAHRGTKVVTINAADVDFRGVLRCKMDETQLYALPTYEDGYLVMVDADTGDALNFTSENGVLYYEGPNNYTSQDGALYIDMVIGAGQIETTLQNLKTSYISMTRRGIELYGGGFVVIKSGGKIHIEADAELLIKTGGKFDLTAGVGSTYMRISNTSPDYRLLIGGETLATAPFYVTPDGTARAKKLQLDNSNITEFTQMYGYRAEDNADSTNPIVLDIFVPAECSGVQSLKLSFKRKPFRSYSTGAADGGASVVTSRSGGGGTSENGYGRTDTTAGITEGWGGRTGTTGNHSHTVTGSTTTYTGDHYHTIPEHSHGIPDHWHYQGAHTHKTPDHSHTIDLGNHSHGLIHGIYQGPTATTCSVYVDGTYVGAWAALTSYDVVAWLTKTSGKITRDTWHTIAIHPNSLSRVVADAFIIALVGRANNAVY